MIRVELTFDSFDEAAEVMLRLATPVVGDAPAGEPVAGETVAEGQKRRRRTKAEMEAARAAEAAAGIPATESTPVVEAPAIVPAEADLSFFDSPAEEAPKPLTKEEALAKFTNEVRPALGAVMKAKGQDAARQVVIDFGFERVSEIPGERYDEFILKCKQVLV